MILYAKTADLHDVNVGLGISLDLLTINATYHVIIHLKIFKSKNCDVRIGNFMADSC